MISEHLQELLEGGVDVDWFSGVDGDRLRGYLGNLQAHRCRLDAVEANVLVAINRLNKKAHPSARPSDVADDVKEQTGESGPEANRKARRAELFDRWPQITAALAEGCISAGHADLLSAIPQKYHDQLEADLHELLSAAAAESVDEFKKTLRLWRDKAATAAGEDAHQQRIDRRGIRFADQPDGMGAMVATYDPESYAIVRNRIVAQAQQLLRDDLANGDKVRSHSQRLADALTDICRGGTEPTHPTSGAGAAARNGADSGTRANIVVTMSLADLLAGGDGHIPRGGPISADAVRRLACENGVIPLVLGTDSVILDMGRRTRGATAAQRTALEVRYHGECAVPGCDRPFEWCHIHHIIHWADGGTTDIDNLIPLCTRHHTQIHEGQLHHRRHKGRDSWEGAQPTAPRTILRV